MYIRVISVIWLRVLACDTEAEWTEWFSRDDERGSGDWEKLSDLHATFPDRLCLSPLDIQVNPVTQPTSVTERRKLAAAACYQITIPFFFLEQNGSKTLST